MLFSLIKRRLLTIRDEWRLAQHQVEWRELNRHNHTIAGRLFPPEKVTVGKQTYGTLNVLSYDNPQERLEIGSFCSIATNTCFILSGEHRFDCLSSFPFRKILLHEKSEAICKGPIKICDDVWIGYGSIILSGVTIGQGAVIGAGSVVAKNIPPYAIYAKDRIIKYRFSEKVISSLLNARLEDLNTSITEEELCLLEQPINDDNVNGIIQGLFEL